MDVTSEMAGTVWKLNVKVGDEVEEEDAVIVLESMKMEIPIEAPCDGVVKEIKVGEGDTVQEDDVVAVIDEA